MKKKITSEILRLWSPCEDGYKRFCELFPDGADLRTASDGLIEDGHADWSNWLWGKCKNSGDEELISQCTATAGWKGTATAGDGGTATAGWKGTATAGDGGTATAGDEGIIIIHYIDKDGKYRRKMSFVGEGELKPNTPYKLDENFNFVEAEQ